MGSLPTQTTGILENTSEPSFPLWQHKTELLHEHILYSPQFAPGGVGGGGVWQTFKLNLKITTIPVLPSYPAELEKEKAPARCYYTFTPVSMPVVDTLKSRYASISGVGGL